MLGKLFGKKGREARAAMQVVQNRDLMQAIVYGAFYVAAADGDIGEDEIKKTEKLIANTPQLKGFGPELSNTMDRAEKDFHDGGHRILRMNAEKELKDLAHSPEEAAIVLNVMLTIAEASGGGNGEPPIDEKEMAVLEKAAKLMSLSLKDYL